jgi:hypothetical protein
MVKSIEVGKIQIARKRSRNLNIHREGNGEDNEKRYQNHTFKRFGGPKIPTGCCSISNFDTIEEDFVIIKSGKIIIL